MKKINFFLIVLLQVFAFQAIGQSALDNGRGFSEAPSTPVEEVAISNSDQLVNGSDFDIPGELNREEVQEDDLVFPADFEILREELNASAGSQAVTEQVNGLTKQVEALIQANQQLREENRLIRKSLSTCCSADGLGLTASDSYLVQNSPNPFTELSEVKYFVPEGITNATLEIRDIKGTLMKSYDLTVDGYGKVNIGQELFESGTYIYSLRVGSEVIDSKVMILTK